MQTPTLLNYVDGEARGEPSSKKSSPGDFSDIVYEFAEASKEDTLDAINAARKAAPSWARTPIYTRHEILKKASLEIASRVDELGELLAREEGKTLREAKGEVTRAAQVFDFFAGQALRLAGELLPSVRPGVDVEVTREPLGVVGIITPWNFPIAIPSWKIAPAICYGNTVVFKPSSLVPGSAWHLVDILQRAGLPDGVVNLVVGAGSVVGQTMLDSHELDGISFTGSVATGRRVAASCAEHMRKLQLEMGGKNPLVILDDADLETAVNCATDGAFFSTGQRCTASSRLIVTKNMHKKFIDAMKERMSALRVGHPLSGETDIGPVVDESQLQQDLRYIEIGMSEGARLVAGGERLSLSQEGYYFSPALFDDCDNSMRVSREEIFGPVATVIPVLDYDEALQVANDTDMGLSAGICTQSMKHATHFRKNVQSGMTMLNLPTAGVDFHVPFGGIKGSSLGQREQGKYSVEFFTNVKTSYVSVGQ